MRLLEVPEHHELHAALVLEQHEGLHDTPPKVFGLSFARAFREVDYARLNFFSHRHRYQQTQDKMASMLALVAVGAMDAYITQNPEVSFFTVTYKRHTNFSMEAIEQTFNGNIGFNKRFTTTISRNGDLVHGCILEVELVRNSVNPNSTDAMYPVEQLLKDITLEIGGTQVDKHYATWFRMYDELYRSNDVKEAYRRMTDWSPSDRPGTRRKFYLPLIFYFNRTLGHSLPMVALQFHDVRLTINTADTATMEAAGVDTTKGLNLQLYCDYIFLGDAERTAFAQADHEYLFEQLQFVGDDAITVNGVTQQIRINFNHPTKYLAFVCMRDGAPHGEFTVNGDDKEGCAVVEAIKLQLNGHDKFSQRPGEVFELLTSNQAFGTCPRRGIYTIPFCLAAKDPVQPSGSLNFSRVDNATLFLTWKTPHTATFDESTGTAPYDLDPLAKCPFEAKDVKVLKLFGVNYNVLKVSGGLAGLSYSS